MLRDFFGLVRNSFANTSTNSSRSISSFADELYHASAACADIVIRDHDDISEDRRLGLTMVFLYGILHLADRQAFTLIPNRRGDVMDHLVLSSCGQLIDSFSGPNITIEERKRLLDTAIEKYNEANVFYGTCKKLSPEDNESPKGTFIWEFGKQFASSANHATDIAFVTLGNELLLGAINHLKVSEKLPTL